MNKYYEEEDEIMYHTGLSKELIKNASYAVVPGDPARVEPLAKSIGQNAAFLTSHRDYTTWITYVNKQPVLVMSTGMGGPCVTFAVEELARLGITRFIRVGTTGSIQENIELGDVVINNASVRMEGASKSYAPVEYPAVADLMLTHGLIEAAKELQIPYHVGISVTTDSFWPGQERYDSFGGYVRRKLQGSLHEFQQLGCTNYEMENATLFTLTSVLGLQAASICAVVAKRTEKESIAPCEVYQQAEQRFQQVVKTFLWKELSCKK